MAHQGFAHAGDARLYRGRIIRRGREREPPAAQLQQMFRQQTAARDIVARRQIEIAALRKRHEVAVEQHDRNARLAEPFRDAVIGLRFTVGKVERREEHTSHATLDEPTA